jgi:hypothetical protein
VSAACLGKREKESCFAKFQSAAAVDFRTSLSITLGVILSDFHQTLPPRNISRAIYIGGGRTSSSVILSIFVCLPANLYRAPPTDTKRQPAAARKKSADRTKLHRSLPLEVHLCRLRRSRNE